MKLLTLQGQQFGNWTVLKKSERKGRKKYWLCQCACGRIKSIRADGLVNGSSTQCQNCARRMHGDYVCRLRIAAALIAAEIDRIQMLALQPKDQQG